MHSHLYLSTFLFVIFIYLMMRFHRLDSLILESTGPLPGEFIGRMINIAEVCWWVPGDFWIFWIFFSPHQFFSEFSYPTKNRMKFFVPPTMSSSFSYPNNAIKIYIPMLPSPTTVEYRTLWFPLRLTTEWGRISHT